MSKTTKSPTKSAVPSAAKTKNTAKSSAVKSVVKSITKADLIKEIAESADITQVKAGDILGGLLESIVHHVAAGNEVSIIGFGAFSSKKRAAREGRNPSTGEAIKISAAVVPAFKFGATFKSKVASAKK